jgi:predicted GNAT family acetyltransferase
MSATGPRGTNASQLDVTKNEALNQFEIHIGDELAFLRYAERPGRIALIHTEVPEELEGRGIAGRLASFALDYARARSLRVVPTCPYVRAYIDRHPEYADLVEGGDASGS